MADIVFRYPEMREAATAIQDIAERYKAAAETFETDFIASIAAWEGDSKEKMQRFISGTVKSYTYETVPQLLGALATLLNANADQMQKADQQIAENIPG